jgi:hypothetical protein
MSAMTSEDTGFAHGAAKGSWLCTIVGVVLFQIGQRTGQPVIFGLSGLLALLVGLLLGIIALFGIPRYGAKGILGAALVGIACNGLLVFIFVTNFMAARAKAQRTASDAPSAIASALSHPHHATHKC